VKATRTSIVTTTLPNRAQATVLARAAVAARLAACAQMLSIRSVYWWQGRVQAGPEVLLQFKTAQARTRELISFIRSRHTYEVPEIIVTPILAGDPDYLAWIERETATRPAVPAGKRKPRKAVGP
jgi:periplasmic divalent cation tolerance protein